MENLKKLVGEDIYKQHIEPKLGADKKYFFGEGDFIPKGRFDENNTQLKSQIKERDDQLKELQKAAAGNEELTKRIAELNALNEKTKSDYEAKLQQKEYDHEFEKALSAATPKDPKVLEALIDKEKLTFKDGKFAGLTEQIEALKKTHDYVFDTEPKQTPQRTGGPVLRGQQSKQQATQQPQGQQPWNRRSPYRQL